MKASEVYRNAARAMELGNRYGSSPLSFACHAICAVGGSETHCAAMKKVFAPNAKRYAWLRDNGTQFRILALCFMAAIAEDEERSKR